jgi:release factor glutamine methyltransferase
LERVAGLPILVLPDVFNPALFFSSEALVKILTAVPVRAGMTILDMGTGSGVAAVAAARLGARVVAVDISLEAVRCARINVLLNGVEDLVDVRHSNLFEEVRDKTFDVVLFNPPYYSGTAEQPWEMAWRSTGILQRFAEGLGEALVPDGRALLVVSSETVGLERAISGHMIESRVVWERDMVSERLMVLEWKPLESWVSAL